MNDDVHVTSLHQLLTQILLDGLNDREVNIVGLDNPAHVEAAQRIYDLGRYLHFQTKGAQQE